MSRVPKRIPDILSFSYPERHPLLAIKIWLTGWTYRKKITIAGATGAGIDYPVLLKVGESSGSTGAHFHLEGHSAIFPSGQNQGGDLRFTASDKTTLLNFWVEKVEGTSPNRVAYLWVKVSANLDTNQDIYIYYNNPNATNYSNIKTTFIVGDDFNDNSIDYTIWADLAEGDAAGTRVEELNEYVKFLQTAGNTWNKFGLTKSLATEMGDFKLVSKFKSEMTGTSGSKRGVCWLVDTAGNRYQENLGKDSGVAPFRGVYNPTDGNIVNEPYTSLTYVKFTAQKYGTNITFFLDDVQKWTGTSRISGLKQIHIATCHNATTEYMPSYFDYIFLAKYVSPEPAFSSAGAEERF